jgi:hypothetical protein
MKRWQTSLMAMLRRVSSNSAPTLDALQRETVALQLASGLTALHAATCCTATSKAATRYSTSTRPSAVA